MELNQTETPEQVIKQSNGWRTFGIVIITILVTIGVGYWVINSYLFPSSFNSIQLNKKEQKVLDTKIRVLTNQSQSTKTDVLEPEAYSEANADRNVYFTERELNALLANSTDLSNKLAIDLSGDLASAKLLIDLDPDFPFIGGKTLKVTAGMELRFFNGKPVAILKGVSVWGVPLPNAWLGNMKNIDLIKELGDSNGFWHGLSEGIELIEITEGNLHIKLRK